MTSLKPESIAVFVGLAFVGWYLAKFFDRASETGKTVGNAIGDAIAPLLVGRAVNVKGGVLLPNGERVAWSDVVKEGSSLDSARMFKWRGIKYHVIGTIDDQTRRAVYA